MDLFKLMVSILRRDLPDEVVGCAEPDLVEIAEPLAADPETLHAIDGLLADVFRRSEIG